MRYVIALLLTLTLQAQPNAPAAPRARIEGAVISSSGEPVQGAEVRLTRPTANGRMSAETTVSAPDGKFAFEVEPSQSMTLAAQKAGYLPGPYGARTSTAATVRFGLKEGETLQDLVLTMSPQSVLSGRVLDAAGDPVQSARVYLLQRTYRSGVRQLAVVGSGAFSNDLGEFRVAGIRPGRYYLVALRAAPADGAVALPTFFPSATEERTATPLDLGPGEEKGNLEIRIQEGKAVTVRGRVAGTGMGATRTTFIEAYPEAVVNGATNVAAPTTSASVQPDGSFEFQKVVPGNYLLRTTVSGVGATSRVTGTLPLSVGNQDLNGVVVTQTAGFTITGKVSLENGGLPQLFAGVINATPNNGTNAGVGTAMRLTLEMTDGGLMTRAVTATVDAEGNFKFEGVSPGRYALQQGNIEATAIQSVRLGDDDVTAKGLEIKGDGTLHVVYRLGVPGASGTVTDGAGKPMGGVRVVLWPMEAQRALVADGARSTTTDRLGMWSIGAVRPGSYYAVALEDVEAGLAEYREFLDLLAPQAQKVNAQESTPLVLKLNPLPAEMVQRALDQLP